MTERLNDFLICVALVLAMGATLYLAYHFARALTWLEAHEVRLGAWWDRRRGARGEVEKP